MSLTALAAVWIASTAAALALLACVLTVRIWFLASREVRKLRSIASLSGELAEISAAVTGLAGTVKRLSGRQAVWDHRARKSDAAEVDLQAVTDKNELRRRVGLVAGKPAPHK
jgi:hypothetical protein